MAETANSTQQSHVARSDEYEIIISDCNSITEARINLRPSSLNIKYGPNGIGKSTIARALVLQATGQAALAELTPFKYRAGQNAKSPSVSGADQIQSVLVFDEQYISQFVFQPDEVLRDSFEIFINTPEYQAGIAELDELFEDLRELFVENAALDEVIASLTELRNAFSITKSGAIAKTSKGYKAISMGGKLDNIPTPLIGFEKFLHSNDPAGWLTWQSKGKSFLDLADNCPFCSIPNVDKVTAAKVSAEYESSSVKNMNALRLVIEGLARLFVPERLAQLRKITSTLEEVTPEQATFLANLRSQVQTLLEKFIALKQLSFMSLRDAPDVEAAVLGLKIELDLLDALNSSYAQGIVADMNTKLDLVAKQMNEVKKRVGIQNATVKKSIAQNQDEINEYLMSAGYKYTVSIEESGDSYRMILEHQDAPGHVEAAASHLSFGERNAFALVLFMHQVRREQPDLVVLDDPVSSFDKTKKYAILHKLFHGRKSLRDFTTLMLTHDIEPAIDIVRTATSGQFEAARPAVHFLEGRGGQVDEKVIERDDIKTFSQVCDENIASASDAVIKCIYLRRRYEVHGDRGSEYDVLSSLLHVRDKPTRMDSKGAHLELPQAECEAAIENIKEYVADFDYTKLVERLKSLQELRCMFDATDVGYEKVQIFRVASAHGGHSPVKDVALQKFVNESYHIENEYVMQLNPRDFDAVPEHVVQACAEFFE